MGYLVLAYPTLFSTDFELIQSFRKTNDKFYSSVKPHFTLVFSVDNVTKHSFLSEMKKHAANIEKIDFTLRCATVSKDAFSDYYHLFLVPDEGFSKFVKAHGKLYSGLISENLRLDLDFIPHIGIGNSKDKFLSKRMADEWNRNDFSISGHVNELTVVEFSNNVVTQVEVIQLK